MAGDWIKMRGALLDHPKVVRVARELQNDMDFREWLTPGGEGPMNGQICSDIALRCVTTALLMKVWSNAREHGKFVGDDLVLEHIDIGDLDQMAGAPAVGAAMQIVGWAIPKNGVTLPNFKEFNVPMTSAEKQREYRKRNASVTETLPSEGNEKVENVTSREEKRRSKNKDDTPPADAGPVWGESLQILKSSGFTEKSARGFLGLLCRDYEEAEVVDAVKASLGKANVPAYIRGVLRDKPKKGDVAKRRVAL